MTTEKTITNLPVIITRGNIVFPEGKSSLEIGRKKSLHALAISRENFKGQIIIVSQKDPKENNPLFSNIFEIGTLCSVQTERKYKERSVVNLKGTQRVLLRKIIDHDDYYSVDFEYIVSEKTTKEKNSSLIKQINDNLQLMLAAHGSLTSEIIKDVLTKRSAGEIIDLLAHNFPYISLKNRQKILEEKNIQKR
jgi:ATP-dependent Lon protease